MAKIAPVIDTQFLIEEGSFILTYLDSYFLITGASLLKAGNYSTTIDKCQLNQRDFLFAIRFISLSTEIIKPNAEKRCVACIVFRHLVIECLSRLNQ
jgi:hypothetical protein